MSIVARAKALGKAATKGYVFGATGPLDYDCSGLMWRAVTDEKVYSGERFTTFTFGHEPGFQRITAAQAGVDDIIVWSENSAHGHMGVIDGVDSFYSARSPASGIKSGKISTFKVYPVAPTYYRAIKSDGYQRGVRTLQLHTPNMYGDDVRAVQRVVFHGDLSKVDGYYGAQTVAAVKVFQKAHNLTADGEVGPLTRKAMGLS